jgi:hypothetical protein
MGTFLRRAEISLTQQHTSHYCSIVTTKRSQEHIYKSLQSFKLDAEIRSPLIESCIRPFEYLFLVVNSMLHFFFFLLMSIVSVFHEVRSVPINVPLR